MLILDPTASGALVLTPIPGGSLILEPGTAPVTIAADVRREAEAERWGRFGAEHELRNDLDEATRATLANELRAELRHETRTRAEAEG